ncbi:hypothetical protein ACWHLZ_03510 [Streptomyces chartreusis]
MRPLRPTGHASPASGAMRGLRSGVLAALCVLLPLVGHVLTRCHAPRWIIVAAVAAVAVPGAMLLTRRRLTDTQVVGALAAAQIASHLAYALPGACQAMTGGAVPSSGLFSLVEHGADASPPPGVVLAGHLVTVVVAARLLGVTERLLWQSRPMLDAVHRLLLFVWPFLGRVHGTGPAAVISEDTTPLRSATPVRRHTGRAPPLSVRVSFAPFRPMPIGGLLLP